MRFNELELREELLRSVEEAGYSDTTPIQEQAIPQALAGRDLICCAQTGTGKTAAFALPILQKLSENPRAPLRALILVPTRELAMQVGRSMAVYGKHLELVPTTVYGGVPIEPQEMMLRHGVDILVATPGRLKDHIWRGNIDFRHTQFLVLDEADRMLDMGFIKDVQEIIEMLPEERQSMLFSATLEPEIRHLAKAILRDPVRIEVAPPATTIEQVDQYLVQTSRGKKRSTLETLIRDLGMTRTIVFARTKAGASRLAGQLRERGHRASAIHSDRSQSERIQALEGFRSGKIHILVATDIAARGIDVHDVSHVVNYDLPYAAEDYVHRIGRTARAGRRGTAISLVTPEEAKGVQAIEKLIQMRLPWMGDPMPAAEVEQRPSRPSRATEARPAGQSRRTTRPRQAPQDQRPMQQPAQPRQGNGTSAPRRRRRRPASAVAAVAAVARPEPRPASSAVERPTGVVLSVIRRIKTGLFPAPGR